MSSYFQQTVHNKNSMAIVILTQIHLCAAITSIFGKTCLTHLWNLLFQPVSTTPFPSQNLERNTIRNIIKTGMLQPVDSLFPDRLLFMYHTSDIIISICDISFKVFTINDHIRKQWRWCWHWWEYFSKFLSLSVPLKIVSKRMLRNIIFSNELKNPCP